MNKNMRATNTIQQQDQPCFVRNKLENRPSHFFQKTADKKHQHVKKYQKFEKKFRRDFLDFVDP